MKSVFIETKYEGDIDLRKIIIKKLPKRVAIIGTVQYVDILPKVKDYLEKNNIECVLEKGMQKYPGQILGCDASAALIGSRNADAFLYIGDGVFHPIHIALKSSKKLFLFNPETKSFREIARSYMEKVKMKRKTQIIKFLSAKNVGVIVSTKPGQNNMDKANKILSNFKDKNYYYIVFDTVDYSQLENFNFIDAWVNTACPRIEEDIKVLNFNELKKIS